MSKEGALRKLEAAFRDWFWETDTEMPDIGILVVTMSTSGCTLQYLGQALEENIDWPVLFAAIISDLQAGKFAVDEGAGVPFDYRS